MSRSILVVDDDDAIREVTELTLQTVGGWNVKAASSGADALQIAARETFDAILLDVMMPDMDGPTAFERLQELENARDTPVVLLTAKAQSIDAARFRHLGVAGVITKPFDPMTLADDVSALLGWA